jgi:hypothetical protein
MSTILDSITGKLGSIIGLNGTMPQRKTSGFSIEEFKSTLNQYDGVLPTNLFLVTLYPNLNSSFGSYFSAVQGPRTLSFFTLKADLPGIDIAVDENIPNGIGAIERFPHAAVYGDIELIFIGDGAGSVMNIFHQWMSSVVEFQTNTDGAPPGTDFFKVGYRSDYVCSMEISVYNTLSDKILFYKLTDAFPYRLSQVPLNWASQNDFMTIGVNFFYKSWVAQQLPAGEGVTTGLSFVQKVIKAGTIAQTLATLKKPQSVGDAINLVNNANIISTGLGVFR